MTTVGTRVAWLCYASEHDTRPVCVFQEATADMWQRMNPAGRIEMVAITPIANPEATI